MEFAIVTLECATLSIFDPAHPSPDGALFRGLLRTPSPMSLVLALLNNLSSPNYAMEHRTSPLPLDCIFSVA